MNRIISNDKQYSIFISIALVFLTLIVYWQTSSFEFTSYDDDYFITDNAVVQQGISLKNIVWAFTTVTAGTWQPVTWLSHMLDCRLFGMQAGYHHLMNVLYHIANTLLIFFLLNRLTASVWRSAMVAALFALHPLHVESVAWMAERRDVLSTFWWLVTMWLYAEWVRHQSLKWYLLCCLALIVGLMAKPMLVSLPVILLFFDLWPLKRLAVSSWRDLVDQGGQLFKLVLEKIPLLLISLVNGLITMVAVAKHGDIGSLEQYPLLFRIENAFVAYFKYIFLTFWPVNLIPYNAYPAEIPFWQSGGALVFLLLVSCYCLRKIGQYPFLIMGWAWFVIALLPVIGLIQQGEGFAYADRYTYVPLIGLFIMIAWGGGAMAGACRWPKALMFAGAAILLAACTILSFKQTGYWRNSYTLFNYTLHIDPLNRVALNQVGVELRKQGRYEESFDYLSKAVKLYPDNFNAQVHMAYLYDETGRFVEAIRHYKLAQALQPKNTAVSINLAIAQAQMGDLQSSEDLLAKLVVLEPQNLQIKLNLAFVYFQQNKFKKAEGQFAAIIRQEPGLAEAYNGLGLVYLDQELFDAAIRNFQIALQIQPDFQFARKNLQDALQGKHRLRGGL